MRVLVVGYGSMGRRHAANALALGHEVGVHDTDNERRSQALSSGYVSANDRWLAGVDAVVVATPASQHAQAMRDWWATPMLVEKPLAASAAEIEALVCQPSDVFVGYNWRWHPEVVSAVAANPLPDSIELWCHTRMTDWPGRGYADPLLECSHEIDTLCRWRWPRLPRLVSANTVGCSANLVFDTGDTVVLQWNALQKLRTVRVTYGESVCAICPSLGAELKQSYRDEMVAFLKWVVDGVNRGQCDLAGGLAVMRICEQAKASAGAVR